MSFVVHNFTRILLQYNEQILTLPFRVFAALYIGIQPYF